LAGLHISDSKPSLNLGEGFIAYTLTVGCRTGGNPRPVLYSFQQSIARQGAVRYRFLPRIQKMASAGRSRFNTQMRGPARGGQGPAQGSAHIESFQAAAAASAYFYQGNEKNT